jgi:hypothetical protein
VSQRKNIFAPCHSWIIDAFSASKTATASILQSKLLSQPATLRADHTSTSNLTTSLKSTLLSSQTSSLLANNLSSLTSISKKRTLDTDFKSLSSSLTASSHLLPSKLRKSSLSKSPFTSQKLSNNSIPQTSNTSNALLQRPPLGSQTKSSNYDLVNSALASKNKAISQSKKASKKSPKKKKSKAIIENRINDEAIDDGYEIPVYDFHENIEEGAFEFPSFFAREQEVSCARPLVDVAATKVST